MEFRGKRWTNERAIEKVGHQRVRSLDLFDTDLDDEFLEFIAEKGSLTSIHISSELITDRGLTALASQNQIESFLLSGVPNATDSGIDAICHCTTIRELYLDGTAVTDDAVWKTRNLPALWSLNISNTEITDVGIGRIASKTIDLISFENCPIAGSGFSTWCREEKMSFYGRGSNLTDSGFAAACAVFSRMWNIDISETQIGNGGIQALAGQSPTVLRINKCKIDRLGIKWIVENVSIDSLEIDPSQMTVEDVNRLKKPRRLHVSVYEIG